MLSFVRFLTIALWSSAFAFDFIPKTRDPPSARLYHQMAYMSTLNSLVVFGGQLDSENSYNDIWLFSLATNQWEYMISSTQKYPSNDYLDEKFSHGMFNVEDKSLSCIFAGTTAYGPLNDLWCFSHKAYKVTSM